MATVSEVRGGCPYRSERHARCAMQRVGGKAEHPKREENKDMAIIITTTVSVDAQRDEKQVVVHLKQGDFGTRALRFVPVSAGLPVDFANVTGGSMKAKSKTDDTNVLLLDGTLGDNCLDIVPTEALTRDADEYACEVLLTNADGETLTSAAFTVIVHGTVYSGDAVEHTNTSILSAYFDANGKLVLVQADGEKITADRWEHTHANATATPGDTEGTAGFMSAEDKTRFDAIEGYLNQSVKTTDTPTFASLNIGTAIMIDGETGIASGFRFQ